MKTDRRNFLIQSASLSGVIGLGYLLWETPEVGAHPGDAGRPPVVKPPGDLMKAALARMAAEGKPGVAVRISTDPQHRHLAGHVLINALNNDRQETLELFAEAVFVCLESDVLDQEIPGAVPGSTVIVFDARRRAIAAKTLDFELGWGAFAEVVASLLHGPEEERLRVRAEGVREKLEPAVLGAVTRLFFDEDKKIILDHAPRLASLLVYERRQAAGSRRGEVLASLLQSYVLSANPKTPGTRLPFGVEASPERGGCGDSCDEQPKDPEGRVRLVACGMGRVGPDSRSFVRYLKS
jgi:hypothetical protein